MNERVAALLAAAQNDPELKASLAGATSADEVVAVAAAHGVTVTADDLAEWPVSELSDAELEGAAGTRVHHTRDIDCPFFTVEGPGCS